ncbi:MAG: lysE yggA [Alphaproteobacteria bacterium]|nr:lysE yggA [Alphaproteobacteria bacterium]
MPTATNLIAFCLVALGMVLTPGPNMIYLVSRSITQGRAAGLVSLAGVALGFVFYMLCAAFGITAILLAIPFAYDALRAAGAIYLLWLAWQAIRPGGHSPFQVRDLPQDSPRKLFTIGLVTALFNPKVAVLYLSLLPQFIEPARGNVLGQALILGSAQIVVSVTMNGVIAMSAGSIAGFLGRRPGWATVQRWLMATVLGALALRMAAEARR